MNKYWRRLISKCVTICRLQICWGCRLGQQLLLRMLEEQIAGSQAASERSRERLQVRLRV